MDERRVYLDNAATTPVAKEVLEAMMPYFSEKYGNASSLHAYGREAKDALEGAREKIAKKLNASAEELIFTSGGTESNNLALKGIAQKKGKGHIITCKVEHSAILAPCRLLEKQGFDTTYLSVDKYGSVDPSDVENAIRKDTILVSIGHANNEIGTVQDLEAIERTSGKGNVKWIESKSTARLAYIKAVLAHKGFAGSLYYKTYPNPQNYQVLTATATGERSVATTCASRRSCASASATHPEPVHRSSAIALPRPATAASMAGRAASMSTSVSGRGMSTPGRTLRMR